MTNNELQEAVDSLRDYLLNRTNTGFTDAYDQYILLLKEQVKRAQGGMK